MLKQFMQLWDGLFTNPPASAPASASSTAQSTTIATPEELLVAAAQQGDLREVQQLILKQDFNSNTMAPATLAAAKNKHWKVVLRLMNHGASLTTETLILAIKGEQKDVIKEFLQQQQWFGSLFNWAVKNNHIEIVTLLLEKDAKIDNSTDPNNNTLILATRHHASAEMCRLLIEKGAYDVNVVDHDGRTPLSLALTNKREDTAGLLFEKGATIDNSTDPDNNTLICAIHARASSDTLKLIIEQGADINLVMSDGSSPLELVIRQQRLDIISLFLEKGAQSAPASASSATAQPSTTTTSEELPVAPAPASSTAQSTTIATTPEELLVAAAQQGDLDEVIQLILKQDFNSNTMAPATLAAAKNKHWKVVLTLIGCGASLTTETLTLAINEDQKDVIKEFLKQQRWFGSLFNWAVKNKCIEIVTLLLAKDAIIDNSTNLYENTLLLAITHNASAEMCRLLIEKGASVNVVGNYGDTPLSRALTKNQKETVKLLFEKGAKIDNSTDLHKNTLILAIYAGANSDTLKLLIEQGADINLVMSDGSSPLELVIRQQRLDIISLFLDDAKLDVAEATFMKAVQNRQWDVLEPFIARNLTFDTRSTYTLIILLAQDKRWDLVQQLLPSTIDEGDLDTLFSLAIEDDQVEIVTALFDKKQDFHLADDHTPLELAALCGSEGVVELLISRKEDVNSTGLFGYTPLKRAINSDNLKIVKLLVGGGATVKPSDPVNCQEGKIKQFLQETLRSQNAKGSEALASSSSTAALLVQSNPFQSQEQGERAVTPVPAAMEKSITSLPANSFQ